MHLNPYVAGNPVGGSKAFIGRADVLRSVLRVLNSPGENALVLFGQRRIGKTSVLRELERLLPESGAFTPVYFDLQDKAALPLDMVLAQLAQRIVSQLGLGLDVSQGNGFQDTFQSHFIPDVLGTMAEEASLVILFDEFDVLDAPDKSQAGAAFFPYLRDLLSLDPRLQFIFVIGRRPEDLSSLTLSVFKGIKSERISLLSLEDTRDLAGLALTNGSLMFPPPISFRIFQLTGGHPYLTQQLCQEVWEKAHESDPDEPPKISNSDVEDGIEPALRQATNALEWLWDGLSPAQRIVAAALASVGDQAITQEELEQRLQESGVRILVGELQDAPRLLEEWDLIEPAADGYLFRTELLRRWIAERKPLNRVQEELDQIEPAAENLFQAAYALYQGGNLEQATPLLRQTIELNPNHTRGSQVLSEILLAQGDVDEALVFLRGLYQYNAAAARPRLVQALLAQAKGQKSNEELLPLYQEILEIDPQQAEARRGRQQIWIAQIGDLESDEHYGEALTLAKFLAAELPADDPSLPNIDLLERKTQLVQKYQQALGALEADDKQTAIQLLTDIVRIEPAYQETTRYLHLAVTGEDVDALHKSLALALGARETAQNALGEAQRKLLEEQGASGQLNKEVEQLRRRLGEVPSPIYMNWRLWAGLAAAVALIWLFSIRYLPNTIATALATATPTETLTTMPVPLTATPDASRWGAQPPTDPITGTTWLDPAFDITFVYVPEGEFVMGSEAGDDDETPVHTVFLDGYWIMQTEVTNAMYQACVEADACSAPNNSIWDQADKATHPVTHVDWRQSQEFSEWIGGSLPTEAQWEKAARGTAGRTYPWGEEAPSDQLLNFNREVDTTTVVGTYPKGASPYGALDMAGNVWEWTADWFATDYYAMSPKKNPQGPDKGGVHTVRGGSWYNPQAFVRVSSRVRNGLVNGYVSLGVRVVRAASPGS